MAVDQSQRRSEREFEGAGQPYVPPAAPAVPAPQSTGGGGGGGGAGGGKAPTATASAAPTSRPAGGWTDWKDVPVGEQNWIAGQVDLWEQSIGFQGAMGNAELLELVNAGAQTQHDIGQFALKNWPAEFGSVLQNMPWAQYGLDKDTYAQMTGTFGTEYKKITGQDITKEGLQQAFLNPRDPTGGLLSASQYAQQLMNDASIQKTYGWVKYGLDFTQWTQQKLQLRSAYGRDINDAEASTVLQYTKATAGGGTQAIARQTQQAPAGVGQSVAR